MSAEKYKNLKVKELQELLQKSGLPHTGKKEELVDRLVKHDEQTAQELATLEEEFGDLEEFDDSKLALDDITDPTKALEEEVLEAPVAVEAKTEEEKTSQVKETVKEATPTPMEPIVKPNSNFKFTPITFDKKSATTVEVTKEEPKKGATETPVKLPIAPSTKVHDDAEKALERAKRFGIRLNETAKKDIRAQRFGISSNTPPATTTTKSSPSPKTNNKGIDPEVLKKRAERFGIQNAKPATAAAAAATDKGKVPATLDPAEEEKKRKRAERFNNEAAKKQKAE